MVSQLRGFDGKSYNLNQLYVDSLKYSNCLPVYFVIHVV